MHNLIPSELDSTPQLVGTPQRPWHVLGQTEEQAVVAPKGVHLLTKGKTP